MLQSISSPLWWRCAADIASKEGGKDESKKGREGERKEGKEKRRRERRREGGNEKGRTKGSPPPLGWGGGGGPLGGTVGPWSRNISPRPPPHPPAKPRVATTQPPHKSKILEKYNLKHLIAKRGLIQ